MRDAYALIKRARKRLAIIDAEYLAALAPEIPPSNHWEIAWLTEESHISRVGVRQRISCLGWLRKEAEPLSSKSDDERIPALRNKVSEGAVGAGAVQKIDKAVKNLPRSEHARVVQVLDEHVSEVVTQMHVNDLGTLSHQLRATLGLDDPYTDEDRQRLWGVKVGPQRANDMSRLAGLITPHFVAMPKRLQADYGRPGGFLEEDAKDERAPKQWFHDALEAAADAGFGISTTSKSVQSITSVVTVAHISDITKIAGIKLQDTDGWKLPGTRKAINDGGVRMSITEAVEKVAAGNSFLRVLGDKGQSLLLGRSQRLGMMAQYLALCNEEGGSSAPDKAMPPAMCDMHHIESWARGGGTDTSNLTFVDPGMHREIDDNRSDDKSWRALRLDECEGEPVESERMVWIEPGKDRKTNDSSEEKNRNSNQDSNAFDNPGRWLQRTLRQKGVKRN